MMDDAMEHLTGLYLAWAITPQTYVNGLRVLAELPLTPAPTPPPRRRRASRMRKEQVPTPAPRQPPTPAPHQPPNPAPRQPPVPAPRQPPIPAPRQPPPQRERPTAAEERPSSTSNGTSHWYVSSGGYYAWNLCERYQSPHRDSTYAGPHPASRRRRAQQAEETPSE